MPELRGTSNGDERLFEEAVETTLAEMQAAISTCHEKVDCPLCGAEIGEPCVRMRRARPPVPAAGRRPVKWPHRERWTRVVPAR